MTNTALKAQIDSQITNETTPLGITPTEVGSNLKEIVDYVDQQLPYKVYTAVVSHVTGNSAPTAVVLQNTIGEVLVYDYSSAMDYGITSNSDLFATNKTVVFISSPSSPLMKVGAKLFNQNYINIITDNDVFSGVSIEIRVYN
jgi:hypothetical protein